VCPGGDLLSHLMELRDWPELALQDSASWATVWELSSLVATEQGHLAWPPKVICLCFVELLTGLQPSLHLREGSDPDAEAAGQCPSCTCPAESCRMRSGEEAGPWPSHSGVFREF
jgi:hypothetical protein